MLNIFKTKKRFLYFVVADFGIADLVFDFLSYWADQKHSSYTLGNAYNMALVSTLTEDEIMNELKKVFGKKFDVSNDGVTISVKSKNRA